MNYRIAALVGFLVSSLSGQSANFPVTTTNHNGPGSLSQAIIDANSNPGADLISFNLPGPGFTISPSNALPVITDSVTIDGTTQPGFATNPIVEINGTSAGAGTDGLRIFTSNSLIRGLVINRFLGDGIEVTNAGNNVIEGNFIGVDPGGTIDRGNSLNGVLITNTSGNLIGGTNRNLISGNNQNGIQISGLASSNNLIVGNVIGLSRTEVALANSVNGVFVAGPWNLIGGTSAGSGNVISGNGNDGIELNSSLAFSNRVEGNWIGTDRSGRIDRGNGADGILFNAAASNLIGGTVTSARNLISGNNSDGIEFFGLTAAENLVQGNYIGTDLTGGIGLGNSVNGVLFSSNARSNLIGGILSGEANLIAFNGGDGIWVNQGTNNALRGNPIFSNGGLGIDIGANGVTANDLGDADTGANQQQNFPTLTGATNQTSNVAVSGTLNSRPSTLYQIDFYSSVSRDPTTNGEGERYLGSTSVTTDAIGNASFDLLLTGTLYGRYVAATATDPFGNTSEFSPALAAQSTVAPASLSVVNTNDSGAGSLRQALLDSMAHLGTGPDTISFNIPGSGPHRINPSTPLPTITESVIIDGFSQPGAQANTAANSNNAIWKIELIGSGITSTGLLVDASSTVIRGLAIGNFSGPGIQLTTNAAASVVEGNLVGLGLDNVAAPNAHGVLIQGAGVRVGGSTPAARNILSGNSGHGILLTGGLAQSNLVQGNFIGTDLAGTLAAGNGTDGIQLTLGSSFNRIGGASAGEGNWIAGNGNDGIELNNAATVGNQILGNQIGLGAGGAVIFNNGAGIINSSARSNVFGGVLAGEGNIITSSGGNGINLSGNSGTNNPVRGNRIYGNNSLGIDLANNGVTANDAGDTDTGPNQSQNFPILTSGQLNAGSTTVGGTLNSRSNTTYQIDLFANLNADPSGNGEGEFFLGSTTVNTDASGNGSFNVTLPVQAGGRHLTAVATDPLGNSSEFSPAFAAGSTLTPLTLVVINTNDSGPGSLRQAMLDASSRPAGVPNQIHFNIPGTGPHTITPIAQLPTPTEPILLDGYTQPGSSVNTQSNGFDAVLKIRLDGISASGFAVRALRLRAPNNVIRGLVFVRWDYSPIEFAAGGSNRVAGCLIGIDVDGSDKRNDSHGITIDSAGNEVGGLSPADRNVISYNFGIGVFLTSANASNNLVRGNFIGTDFTARTNRGNLVHGVNITDGSSNTIGGTLPSARNIISGNSTGIRITANTLGSAAGNVIQGNHIGTDVTGTTRIGNREGIEVERATGTIIGGSVPGARNIISGNLQEGIDLYSEANGTVIKGNWIGIGNGGVALSNNAFGIGISGSSNQVGGALPGEGNTIAYNHTWGVLVAGTATSVQIRGNVIFANNYPGTFTPGLGIELFGDGVTTNDLGDVDTGVNNRQNFPVITAASGDASSLTVQGTLNSAPSQTYQLDFFANISCDASGFGEGQFFLGSISVNTDATGNAPFNATLPVSSPGRFITATATDPAGNSSEFCSCFSASLGLAPLTFTVTTTNDSGAGSLRQAILDSNNHITSSNNTIAFNIPGTGVRSIHLLSSLPVFVQPVTIDGFTQPGASANTLSTSNNANWLIELNGSLAPANQDGLRLNLPGLIVRGLRITRFQGEGIEFTGSNAVVTGNFIFSNYFGGLNLDNAHSNQIGGSTPAERNIISGHGGSRAIELLNSHRNRILGNFVGPDANEGGSLGAQFEGISFFNSSDNLVGDGTVAGANLIAWNGGEGVFVQSGTNNSIRVNRFFGNSAAIELGFDGVNPNDAGDTDGGANQGQNYPVLTNAIANAGNTVIQGLLNSLPNRGYWLDFYANAACDFSGHGEGQFFLGSGSATTDGAGNAPFNFSFPVTINELYLTAIATDPDGNSSEFSPCLVPSTINIPPRTFVVTTLQDSGPGSLRQALLDAGLYLTGPNHQIHFNIPGSGVRTIALSSPLPPPQQSVTIDGFTQPGAQINNSDLLDNSVRLIRLSASNLNSAALNFTRGFNRIRGLELVRIDGTAIELQSGSNVVEGNLIASNSGYGISVVGSHSNLIGGAIPSSRNIISSNYGSGIYLNGISSSNRIIGNLIGLTATGGSNGNRFDGIAIDDGRNNQIGDLGQGNRIAYNGGEGVVIVSATNNTIRGNAIYGNGTLGIDLGGFGVTPNDLGDNDGSGNLQQNFPILNVAAVTNQGVVSLEGTLNSRANRDYRIDFYFNNACDANGYGEGEISAASTTVTTDASGNAAFGASIPFTGRAGFFTATATDPDGNTSEFCACRAVTTLLAPITLTVVNTNDSGAGSFRQAILTANGLFTTGTNSIAFNIPGSGEKLISVSTPLPPIVQAVVIDGYTQPGAQTNSSAAGNTAVVPIRIDGLNAGANASGLLLQTGSNTVRGLAFTRFNRAGIEIPGASNVVEGNLVGVAQGFTFPTTAATTATLDPASTGNGVGILVSGSGNRIGGLLSGQRNVISGNDGDGVLLTGATAVGNQVTGNWIGHAVDPTERRGNLRHGVGLDVNASRNSVQNNLISHNAQAGIGALGGNFNAFRTNSFQGNGGLPIDLAGDGPTPNDLNDADAGPNGLKNYPVLTKIQSMGAVIYVEGYFPRFNTPQLRQRNTAIPSSEFFEYLEFLRVLDEEGPMAAMGFLLGGNVSVDNDGTFEGTISGSIPPGTQVAVTATGNGSTSEASTPVTVTPPPAAQADIVTSQRVISSDNTITNVFTIVLTVSNAGPATATNVLALLTPPMDSRVVGTNASAGAAGNSMFGYATTVPTLAPGATFTVTVQVIVGSLGQHSASGSASSNTDDPNPLNNLSESSFGVADIPQNRVGTSVRNPPAEGPIPVGQQVFMVARVENTGPSNAGNAQLEVQMPYGSQVNDVTAPWSTVTAASANENFVRSLYSDLLRQQITALAMSQYVNALNNGTMTRDQLVALLIVSPAARFIFLENYYKRYLEQRRLCPEDIYEWTPDLEQGISIQDTRARIIASHQYFLLAAASMNLFVINAYRDLLNRPPSPPEVDSTRIVLWSSMDRSAVSQQLLNSTEGRTETVRTLYDQYLRRDPTSMESGAWLNRFQQGDREEDLITEVLSSSEYAQNVGSTYKLNGTLGVGASHEVKIGATFNRLGMQRISYNLVPHEYDLNYDDNFRSVILTVVSNPVFDYGDAPDSYKTLAISGGPSHASGLRGVLGATWDLDLDGQPLPNALGDDLDEGDDEDGVIFRGPLAPGVLTAIEVTATWGGFLDFWIDFNRNGQFEHRAGTPNEYVNDRIIGHTGGSYLLLPGRNIIQFFLPSNGVVTGLSFARFRFSSTGGLTPVGPASDGEVEDYQVALFDLFPDFGDAPDADGPPDGTLRYPTLLVHNGAYHLRTIADFYLGRRIDHEGNGQPDDRAIGDDEGNGADFPETTEDDEDGVTFLNQWIPGTNANLEVFATIQGLPSGKLDAWVDWTGDGAWDFFEKVLNSVNLLSGTNQFQIAIPPWAARGWTYARFRMSRDGNLGPSGPANTGEVEDYAIYVGPRGFSQERVGNNLLLTWPSNGILQWAPTILGPWQDLPSADSPYTVRASEPSGFYRVKFF